MRTLINKYNTSLQKNDMRSLITKYNTSLSKAQYVLSLIGTVQTKTKHHAFSH
jgi:hypothetical protein